MAIISLLQTVEPYSIHRFPHSGPMVLKTRSVLCKLCKLCKSPLAPFYVLAEVWRKASPQLESAQSWASWTGLLLFQLTLCEPAWLWFCSDEVLLNFWLLELEANRNISFTKQWQRLVLAHMAWGHIVRSSCSFDFLLLESPVYFGTVWQLLFGLGK